MKKSEEHIDRYKKRIIKKCPYNIAKIRKAAGIHQKEIANYLGVEQHVVSMFEKHPEMVNAYIIMKIVDYCRKTVLPEPSLVSVPSWLPDGFSWKLKHTRWDTSSIEFWVLKINNDRFDMFRTKSELLDALVLRGIPERLRIHTMMPIGGEKRSLHIRDRSR